MAVSFEDFLNEHDGAAWTKTIGELLPGVHEVDRAAMQIWFAFYPLDLLRALQHADAPARLVGELHLQGSYQLADQIDSSHEFLYGHRYWTEVKRAVIARAETFSANLDKANNRTTTLADELRAIANEAAAQVEAEVSLLLGITAVALMTLQQVGLAAFKAAPGTIKEARRHDRRTPAEVLRARAKDDAQGVLGFLRTTDKRWTVTFDEHDAQAKFKILHDQDLAAGAAADARDWRTIDPRRIEGPIPVECRSAACGTCWVGVLGGADKLRDMNERERRRLKEFGYIDTTEPRPLIRLACMARALGAVSIVIPPWNGVFGKFIQQQNSEHGTQNSE